MIVSSRRQRLLLAALGAFIFPLAQAAGRADPGAALPADGARRPLATRIMDLLEIRV